MTAVTIRPEMPGDEAAIHALTAAAFRDMPFSDGSEPQLVDRMRNDGDLFLSLVAEDDIGVAGHIAFSPVTISGSTHWFQLSPLSVRPDCQRTGIGSALIERGIAGMRERGAQGIALVGNPAYYQRFGFTRDHALSLSDAMDPFLQILVLSGEPPRGQLKLAPAFG